MVTLFPKRRDLYAGALISLIGAGSVAQGFSLNVGSLNHMGPGFLPATLGVLLILLGLAIAVTGMAQEKQDGATLKVDLRAGICIVLGVTAFIVLGWAFGYVPGTFFCILISALGDRKSTLKNSLILAGGLTAAGAILFPVLLKIPFPLFTLGPE